MPGTGDPFRRGILAKPICADAVYDREQVLQGMVELNVPVLSMSDPGRTE